MPNFTQATIIGHLTRDPETKNLPSGMALTEFSVAVNTKRKDEKKVSFFDCKAFGKTAETIAQYFQKGKAILVNCRIEQESWDAKDGTKRSKVVFIVNDFAFMGGKGDSGDETDARVGQAARVPQNASNASDDSSIPF